MKTDMSSEAITYRLRKTSELLRLCLALGRNSFMSKKKAKKNISQSHGPGSFRERSAHSARKREPFDYTKWRAGLDEDLSIEEISNRAMKLRKKTAEPGTPSGDT